MNKSFYDFSAISIQGKEIKMSDYKGKIVVVVNTASQCGFTPQLEGLENLYKKYQNNGLEILGFPSNQFGNQEPGDEKSIEEGCVVHYGVTFPMFSKIDVNGKDAHPLYQYLKSKAGGIFGSRITWNFTKFLVNHDGQPVKRYAPITKPEKMEKMIQELLKRSQ